MARTISVTIADNIKAYRKQRGLSQKALANLTSLDQSHLSRIEKSTITVSLEVLDRIAKALKIPAYVFLKSERTEDIPLWEKLRKLDELDQDKRDIILNMLDAFLHEKELLDKRKETEKQVLKELKSIRKKSNSASKKSSKA